ncbi:ribosomal protein S18 acetylase RimI-like enzyme [Bradyrhizobium sp. AZCC 1610]|uniref:GNAT family N-acetyltransferase n=1 Tax=Bradyrhizobium sp. AZCC 1610 TaxID=3117020 RepID=UPI002FEEA25B
MATTRPITPRDLDLVCRHREAMFRESNAPGRTEDVLKAMTAAFRVWAEPRLKDGSYFGYIVEDAGASVAGIGLMVINWPPHPSHPLEDKRGYVLNVFTEPSHRRRGLGSMLMELGEAELRKRGVSFCILHATRMGKPLYERMGWTGTSEIAKILLSGEQK